MTKRILQKEITEEENRNPVLTIGCDYEPIRGGIAQVLYIYDKYIFEDFHFIANSGEGCFRNIQLLLSSIYLLIKQLLRDRRIRIVHIHTASYNSFYRSAIFVVLSRLLGRKVILHIHGGGFLNFYKTYPRMIGWILELSDCLLVLSETWRIFFEKALTKPLIRVIPNPVVVPQNENLGCRQKSPHLRLLFLGLLDAQKGIYDLLQGLASNKEYFENKVVLHIGGNGDVTTLIKTIQQMGLESLVTFHGWVSGDKKKELLLNSDVFVLPSYIEGLPMSILEAMSYGLVIVSTNVGAIPEVVSPEYGYLISPGDIVSLVDILKMLSINSGQLLKLKEAAITAGKSYSVEHVAQQLEAVYLDLLR